MRYPFDFTENVCEGQKWKGFGWKMKQFLKYVQRHPNDTMTVLVDGKDMFTNHDDLVLSFWDKFNRLNADVIVSSDELCRGDVCNGGEREKLLMQNLPFSRSAFANSPIAGRAWALEEALVAMLQRSWSDTEDDQVAATDLVITKLRTRSARVVLDVNQTLFGSFLHLAPARRGWLARQVLPLLPAVASKNSNPVQQCTDGKGTMFHNCSRVPIHTRKKGSVTLQDNVEYIIDPQSCSVRRIRSALDSNPVFWHGNWLGRQVFNAVQKRRFDCFYSK